jgi:hypothetical protein
MDLEIKGKYMTCYICAKYNCIGECEQQMNNSSPFTGVTGSMPINNEPMDFSHINIPESITNIDKVIFKIDLIRANNSESISDNPLKNNIPGKYDY